MKYQIVNINILIFLDQNYFLSNRKHVDKNCNFSFLDQNSSPKHLHPSQQVDPLQRGRLRLHRLRQTIHEAALPDDAQEVPLLQSESGIRKRRRIGSTGIVYESDQPETSMDRINRKCRRIGSTGIVVASDSRTGTSDDVGRRFGSGENIFQTKNYKF